MENDAPQGTQAALIAAGLHLFGQHGFAATSTRDLAARAGTNVASIAYHFGGKEGLRRACLREVARRMQSVLSGADRVPDTPEAAARQLETMLRALVFFLTTAREAADLVGFMLREIGEDGPALDEIYQTLIEPRHRAVCTLWARATGQDPDSEEVRISVFAFIGQAIYFRIGRPIVERRMGWAAIGPAEAQKIVDRLTQHLRAILAERHAP
ncbi:CerR family C-terminal domain-containing protein [Defluviimonas sp. WL0002]|uniref:CerR family C-terminal domain-containing protein n=1 Tax=Albidovulum marisflavi TaxID=2984159 RepID=A0ABT2Z7N5_9RHOB|nr:CerR family C-terminal domain-containing protein [Defluviimonas sp. WL0002]MCV2867149.1 CerR family C-terminal domain-containing protein [Defluviimonas sp. WL0002]